MMLILMLGRLGIKLHSQRFEKCKPTQFLYPRGGGILYLLCADNKTVGTVHAYRGRQVDN
jgi:hypothetical protein